MKSFAIRTVTPLALGLLLAVVGCAKAKSALETAAGFAPLAQSDIDAIKTSVGWPATIDANTIKTPQGKAYAGMTILGGVALSDNFPGDLSTSTSIGPIPFDIPDSGKDTAGNLKSLMLVKVLAIKVDANTTYSRLQIVSVAKFDPDTKNITIDGTSFDVYIDADQVVSKGNKNQNGNYLLIEAQGNKGIQYLSGKVQLKGASMTAAASYLPVSGASVFTTTSPFATITGASGMYLLATIQDSKGSAIAFDATIAATPLAAPDTATAIGTPTSATAEVTYTGVLDDPNNPYAVQATAKVGEAGTDLPSASADIKADYTKANTLVTDFLGAWKVSKVDLLFIQPPQVKPAPPAPPANPAVPVTPPPPVPPAATPPPTDPTVERRDPAATDTYLNVDLGCNGFDDSPGASNVALPVLFDGSKFDDYQATHGWRAQGDVRIAFDFADVIFPAPPAGDSTHYLDPGVGKGNGYCLLTTGDQLYLTSNKADAYNPGPADAGQVSEMWQKVHVPAAALSVQARVAFFSQEFPKFVGSQYNDSFFIKFDESPNVIASGNLNDLAGANSPDPAISGAVSGCAGAVDGTDKTKTCGDWMFVVNPATGLKHGQLWGIENSDQAPTYANNKFGCAPAGAPNNKCYHGMITPRIICKNLDANDQNQVRTLRLHVEDAGDKFFDSALAVDSIVFSTKACEDKTGRMTPDPISRANELGN